MHWLAHRVSDMLDSLPGGASATTARREFLDRVAALVDEIARREGIVAAFASYEGLLVAAAGRGPDFEALAAMAQAATEPALDSAAAIELGELRQLVLVGDRQKLALVRVGPVTIGMLCPTDVNLGAATA